MVFLLFMGIVVIMGTLFVVLAIPILVGVGQGFKDAWRHYAVRRKYKL